MVSEQLKAKAVNIIQSNSNIFHTVKQKYHLTEQQVLDAFIYYNSNVEEIDNSVYDSLETRAAMFIEYLIKGSWHEERQNVLVDFLKYCNPKSILDIGFGAPTKYVMEYVLKSRNIKLTLADKFESAFSFAEIVLNDWHSDFTSQISFKKVDVSDPHYLGDYELYIFQDAIEHSAKPKEFLSLNVKRSLPGSWFIFSLPIAPMIPCHFISWDNVNDASAWIESCGLKVVKQKQVFVNPKVDEFAKDLGNISNLMLITQKV